ncbi:MAG: 30S ribosomal protein S17 [Candidatus Yanofskybacteria bacterium RIFCSPLOWO2_02_FULL_45_10]|uniref:Small ribosomal subunit protein uS17 n=2 Tax=Candidatus Yanofskyibacteriota TaxID=1752733 RepID=A0A1F8G3C4_9BACT|nr:MAG: 30S ribosomal protein S17 [Candidatus Yanofskybacteria bacterium RIFCSPHIGHO2_12_FULL_45_19b]OGN32658.1 MAG: 30S ribosomal protein S17 [Candidatus Yanofskybacteria bacterium RIFCSPLOWO2_02_FULL_45_10]HXK35731.1 30S ribosomal protein S17 [Candidatus Paceibacterota bacterium]
METATQKTRTASKRTLTGVVVSLKMAKTVVVAVTRLKMHPKYKKQYKVTKKFKAHNESGQFVLGDRVTIVESKPISKDKHWIVKI